MLTLLVTGVYMAITRWGGQPFVIGGLAGIVLLGALGGAVTGRRLQGVEPKLRAAPGQVPAETRRTLGDRALDVSLRTRTTLAIGIDVQAQRPWRSDARWAPFPRSRARNGPVKRSSALRPAAV